jgi:hypothetical protein
MKTSLVVAALLGVVGVVPLAVSAGAAPASLTGLSGTQILALTTKAADTAGTVTRVATIGSVERSVTTSTLNSATQSGTANGHVIDDVYVAGVVYVKFDAATLTNVFGAKTAPLAHRWIAFTKGHPYFAEFTNGLTLPSLISIMSPAGKLSVSAPLVVGGHSVVQVTGFVHGATSSAQGYQTIDVSTTAPYVPWGLSIRSGSGAASSVVESVAFKNWGASVSITRPLNAIASWKTAIG